MIKTETITINGHELVRTYSDANMMIRQDGTGVIYAEAVDPVDSGRTYTETETEIEMSDDEKKQAQLEEDSKALKILLGEDEA